MLHFIKGDEGVQTGNKAVGVAFGRGHITEHLLHALADTPVVMVKRTRYNYTNEEYERTR
jgi:hypothetical protein